MSFYSFTSTAYADADQLMENFLHVYQGNRLPMSATASGTLTASDGNLDLGSSTYRWRNLYCNNIIVASSTITAPYMWTLKGEVTLSSTAASIEFAGLNGDNAEEYMLSIVYTYTPTATAINYTGIYYNGDSATNYYLNCVIDSGPMATAMSLFWLSGGGVGVTGQRTSNIILKSKTGKPRVASFEHSIRGGIICGHCSWSNTSSTLTSIKMLNIDATGSSYAVSFPTGTTVKLWSRN